MINRRHIRIKVMQSVYAIQQSKSDQLDSEERFLLKSIDKMYDLYILLLSLLIEVRKMEKIHIDISKKKYLVTKEELDPNTKFIDNRFLDILSSSVSLKNHMEVHKINNWELDREFVNEIWKLMKESDVYKNYMNNSNSSFKEDKEFLLQFFKEIIAPNEKLADYFEDQNISWVDDIPFVNTWIVKTFNQLNAGSCLVLKGLYKDEEDKKFVLDLFRKVVLSHDDLGKEIEDKTPNWDTDRIADIDLILIKMSICEFLKFPSIPTRVTINEYIEISKDYSTNKSSYFINGVLDKILKEFTASKRLNKIGRGLL